MSAHRFAFGSFLFDDGRRLLFEHGTPVSVGQRAIALLGTLLAAGGDVVSKSLLMDAAWPGLYVEESNLTVQMAALRRRLGSSPRGEDWIATFPRVGYRFAGPFRRETPAGELPRTPAPRSPASPDGRPPIDLQAYELYVRGQSLLLQSPRGNRLARSYLLEAMQRAPGFAPIQAYLGVCHFGEAVYYGADVAANRAAGTAHVNAAVALDPDDATARWALGFVHLYSGAVDEAQAEWEIALRQTPNQPDILAKTGDLLVQQGETGRGIAAIERAIAVSPFVSGCTWWDLGFARYAAGHYAEAITALRRDELAHLPSRRILAASLAQLGRMDEARAEAQAFLIDSPGFTIGDWAATQSFRHADDREHFVEGYVKAGLPR